MARLEHEAPASDGDTRRCPLCGGPNGCALALPEPERPDACWCVARAFPRELLARAPAGACICAACLERAGATHPQRGR